MHFCTVKVGRMPRMLLRESFILYLPETASRGRRMDALDGYAAISTHLALALVILPTSIILVGSLKRATPADGADQLLWGNEAL